MRKLTAATGTADARPCPEERTCPRSRLLTEKPRRLLSTHPPDGTRATRKPRGVERSPWCRCAASPIRLSAAEEVESNCPPRAEARRPQPQALGRPFLPDFSPFSVAIL